jgi:uncharacterized membrane protein
MAEAIVLLDTNHTNQQMHPTRVLVLQGRIGLPRHLIVIVVLINIIVISVMVIIVVLVIVFVHVDVTVARTSARCARSTSGPG